MPPGVDILANVARSLLLTPVQLQLRNTLISCQQDIIKKIWPGALCKPIGSFVQETAMKGSDIDMMIYLAPPKPNSKQKQIKAQDAKYHFTVPQTTFWARRLAGENLDAKIIKGTRWKLLDKAQIPVLMYKATIKMKDDDGNEESETLSVDISWQTEEMARRDEFIRERLEEAGAVEAFILLKAWLKKENLDQIYNGGMGSYVLALSLVAFLKRWNKTMSPPHPKRPKVAKKKSKQPMRDPTPFPDTTFGIIRRYLEFYTFKEPFGYVWSRNTFLCPVHGTLMKPIKKFKVQGLLTIYLKDPILPRKHIVGGKYSYRMGEAIEKMRALLEKMMDAGPEVDEEQVRKIFIAREPFSPGFPRNQSGEGSVWSRTKVGAHWRYIKVSGKSATQTGSNFNAVTRPPLVKDANGRILSKLEVEEMTYGDAAMRNKASYKCNNP